MRRTYPKPDECASDAVCKCGHPIGEHRSTEARQCGAAHGGGICTCERFRLDRKAYAVSRGWDAQ